MVKITLKLLKIRVFSTKRVPGNEKISYRYRTTKNAIKLQKVVRCNPRNFLITERMIFCFVGCN